MIELLLQAERDLSVGLVDQAERLYRQASDADPHNSIAVVGLARVALERGDEPGAWRLAKRALGIDPENVAAQRLAERLEEVWAYRGESLAEAARAEDADAAKATAAAVEAGAAPRPAATPETSPEPSAETSPATPTSTPAPARAAAPPPATTAAPRRGVVDRLLRRNRP